MRFIPFLVLFLQVQIPMAQSFTEKVQEPPFVNMDDGDIAFADVDGDNDLDLLVTGFDRLNVGGGLDVNTILYLNDGAGNFTAVPDTPFEEVTSSSIAFADVDGDEDTDVVITGMSRTFDDITKLYLNDGAGNFEEATGTSFTAVSNSSIAFADVDGDEDPDLVISGNSIGVPITILYLNDGAGRFTEAGNTPFEGTAEGSIAFADIDGDDDPDLLITGYTTNLYINDGSGAFTEEINIPFPVLELSAIAFADVDGDEDQDVLLTGHDIHINRRVAQLFTNDGSGVFTEVTGTPFNGVRNSSVAFGDVDGNGTLDALIMGLNNTDTRMTQIYLNDGSGDFTEVQTDIEDLAYGDIAFGDVDGDEDLDVMTTGVDTAVKASTRLYINGTTTSSEDNFWVRTKLTSYPNPNSTGRLHIHYTSVGKGRIRIGISDTKGRLVSRQEHRISIDQQTLTIDISALPSGVYVVRIEEDNSVASTRFVVK
jgi:hypothetical protein